MSSCLTEWVTDTQVRTGTLLLKKIVNWFTGIRNCFKLDRYRIISAFREIISDETGVLKRKEKIEF